MFIFYMCDFILWVVFLCLLESKNKIYSIYDIGYRVNIKILNPPPIVRTLEVNRAQCQRFKTLVDVNLH